MLLTKVQRFLSPRHLLTGQLCIIELLCWGILYYTFSVFLMPMGDELGWSSAELASGFSLALLVAGLAAPFVGSWIDKHDGPVMTLGVVAGVVGLLLWSYTATLASYLCAWALIGVGMAGSLYAPAFATVVKAHPVGSRSSILTISLVGALASTVFLPLSGQLNEWLGWRASLRLFALLLAGTALPLALALPRKSVAVPKSTPNQAAKLDKQFGLLGSAFLLLDTATVAINVHLVSYLVVQGRSLQTATGLVALAGVAKLVGRATLALGSKLSAKSLLLLSLQVKALSLILLLASPSTAAVTAMVLGFGAASGARTVLQPALLLETYGTRGFGQRSGLLKLFTTLGQAVGPLVLGVLIGVAGWSWSWLSLTLLIGLAYRILASFSGTPRLQE